MAASADSSGNGGEQWVERSSGLDYSEDTFESFSEEEPEEPPCWQQESQPSEEFCSTEDLEGSALLGTLERTSQLADQNHAEEQSEVVDSAAVEREVLGKWIELQDKEAGVKQDKSVITTQAERTELLGGELEALGSFCTGKIRAMRQQQLSSARGNGGKSRKASHGLTAENPEMRALSCLVPHRLMNRIRLENVRETVKQVTEAQIHECSACPDCQEKEAELAKITFLRRKKILVESALIRAKLEERIYSTLKEGPSLVNVRNLQLHRKEEGQS